MKASKKIVLILALIAGLICSVLYNLNVPEAKIAYQHSVTEENFQELKDYIIEVTKNSTKMQPDENVQITTGFSDDLLVITADTKYYGVKAEFPVSDLKINFDNGTMKFDPCTIRYDNVNYTEYTSFNSTAYYVCVTLLILVLPAGMIYTIFYAIPREYKKNNKNT